ncbi:hypothetical protein HGA88_03915 [Candidatus Roizmanbacteria bacterium]|nr:hypothetical protein [Candidatus Roizmanbacteria bacterium]
MVQQTENSPLTKVIEATGALSNKYKNPDNKNIFLYNFMRDFNALDKAAIDGFSAMTIVANARLVDTPDYLTYSRLICDFNAAACFGTDLREDRNKASFQIYNELIDNIPLSPENVVVAGYKKISKPNHDTTVLELGSQIYLLSVLNQLSQIAQNNNFLNEYNAFAKSNRLYYAFDSVFPMLGVCLEDLHNLETKSTISKIEAFNYLLSSLNCTPTDDITDLVLNSGTNYLWYTSNYARSLSARISQLVETPLSEMEYQINRSNKKNDNTRKISAMCGKQLLLAVQQIGNEVQEIVFDPERPEFSTISTSLSNYIGREGYACNTALQFAGFTTKKAVIEGYRNARERSYVDDEHKSFYENLAIGLLELGTYKFNLKNIADVEQIMTEECDYVPAVIDPLTNHINESLAVLPQKKRTITPFVDFEKITGFLPPKKITFEPGTQCVFTLEYKPYENDQDPFTFKLTYDSETSELDWSLENDPNAAESQFVKTQALRLIDGIVTHIDNGQSTVKGNGGKVYIEPIPKIPAMVPPVRKPEEVTSTHLKRIEFSTVKPIKLSEEYATAISEALTGFNNRKTINDTRMQQHSLRVSSIQEGAITIVVEDMGFSYEVRTVLYQDKRVYQY